ncbi:MAG: histidine phosphatase family protein [Erythrobacter sp.]|nr:histidine phosphatase family protein [Erythrobacter sp.]
MAKLLGILRHAKSEWDAGVERDFDRGLNDRGRRGAPLMGNHIRDHEVQWDMILASPAVRIKETLDLAELGVAPTYDQRLYLASLETILEVLQGLGGDDEPGSVLIVGHNPGLQETLIDLVAPARENDLFREAMIKFPTGAFAVLECEIAGWSALKARCAELVHFTRPRDLDPALGPQG